MSLYKKSMKTVFLALNFHLKNTKSSSFFIDILKANIPNFSIVNVNNAWHDIPRIKPETIIIWQHVFSQKEIDSWQAKNIIFIPMYDACPHTEEFWNNYKNYKIFCFSKTLYDFLFERNFKVCYSQYYVKPSVQKISNFNKFSVFYWERSKKINWQLVRSLLGNKKIDYFHYHYSTHITNKNNYQPSEEDIQAYNISFSDWFAHPAEYKTILEKTSLYIAPRESEGIGLSFIEALAQGCCVVAYNAPTMNEYINQGIDGYLFDENNINALDFSNKAVQKIRLTSLSRVEKGFKMWEESIPIIIDFIIEPLQNYTPKLNIFLYIYKRLRAEIKYMIKK